MANPLLELVKAGRIADEAALKSAFRGLAKRLHPDLALPPARKGGEAAAEGGGKAAESFITLRREYEEARAWLAGSVDKDPAARGSREAGWEGGKPGRGAGQGRIQPLPWSRRDFYSGLQDLLARGFPRLPRRRWPKGPLALYEDSRMTVMRLLAGRDRLEATEAALPAFLAFEEGWLDLALSDPACLSAEVRISVGLRNLLLNIVGYHVSGHPQALRYSRNEWRRLEGELRARDVTGPLAFLALLMADLAGGPACPQD